jgi:hypothetical protein
VCARVGGAREGGPTVPVYTSRMEIPEQTRELVDVTIRVRETRPGFFEASLKPNSPETHLARGGYSLDTARGLRGRTLSEVLDRAEAHWRQNYPHA